MILKGGDPCGGELGHEGSHFPKEQPRNMLREVQTATKDMNDFIARLDAAPGAKPTNPKDAIGSNKLPLHLWPETATALGCLGFLDGALKYGRANFRAIGVRASIYTDAAKRHLNRWFEGEDIDPDSGLPHLAHALACLAIMVDAMYAGKLNDDRQYPGGYARALAELTPHVQRVKEKYKDAKVAEHYTIQTLAGKREQNA